MSFEHLSSLESQPTTMRGTGYSDDPAFDRLAHTLSSHLFKLTSNVSRLQSQIALMGTQKDSESIRESVKSMLDQTREEFKQVGEGLKKICLWENVSPSQRFSQNKLSRQFQDSFESFQAVQKLFVEKSRQYVLAARTVLGQGGSADDAVYQSISPEQRQEQVSLLQQQLAVAEQSEVDFLAEDIERRQDRIDDVANGIHELNDIFKSLSTMIQQQGVNIDSIEGNVTNTLNSTQSASQELVKANRYQKGARNRACCLLIILAVVLAIILLAILV